MDNTGNLDALGSVFFLCPFVLTFLRSRRLMGDLCQHTQAMHVLRALPYDPASVVIGDE